MVHPKTVTLTTRTPRFVTSEADLDTAVEERTLALPANVYRSALALAQTHGWRARGRALTAGQAAGLAAALKSAMAEPDPAGRRAHLTSVGQLRAFFAAPDRLKQLRRLQAFLEAGVGVDVTGS